jgi:hypothetical protein
MFWANKVIHTLGGENKQQAKVEKNPLFSESVLFIRARDFARGAEFPCSDFRFDVSIYLILSP